MPDPRGPAWTVRLGPNMFVDFCVWVLERDGLRAPPFDRHPDGDGTLRAVGLTAEAWRAWFARVVAAVGAFSAALPRNDDDAWPPFPDPVALWDGAPAVAARLSDLDAAYDAVSNARKDASAHFWWLGRPDIDDETDRLWEALAPYYQRLPPLSVVFVAYPGPARLAVPPATVVLAAVGWQPRRAYGRGADGDGRAGRRRPSQRVVSRRPTRARRRLRGWWSLGVSGVFP